MSRHLAACAPQHDVGSRRNVLLQLRFEDVEDAPYWLDLEARDSASLQQVDVLLRRVWLECCGHLSAFRIGRAELAKSAKVGLVFARKGLAFGYEYDFGSTTALRGRVLGAREGSLGRHVARLLARNVAPRWPCEGCESRATVACAFCRDSGTFLFCDKHADEHRCDDGEAFLPVVNSPRMGVCGYTGRESAAER
jgi:hypothetical protein